MNTRRRMEMLQDCLSILAEGDYDDACVVIESLESMKRYSSFGLRALFRPIEYPVTVRAELVAEHGEKDPST